MRGKRGKKKWGQETGARMFNGKMVKRQEKGKKARRKGKKER